MGSWFTKTNKEINYIHLNCIILIWKLYRIAITLIMGLYLLSKINYTNFIQAMEYKYCNGTKFY